MGLPPNIILLGSMGSGKTSTGRELAALTPFEYVDLDHWIEEKSGKKISDLFREEGESGFRSREKEAVQILARKRGIILSSGGGTWLERLNRETLLKSGWCVWLHVSPGEAWKRMAGQISQRPLLAGSHDPKGEIERLLAERTPIYSEAHFRLFTDGKTPQEVARDLLEAFKKETPFDLSLLQK